MTATTWRETLGAARAEGFDVLDWLSARDDETHAEAASGVVVVAYLVRGDDPSQGRLFSAPAPVASVADLFPSAQWHERETSEMFGVRFEGLADTRPLLLEADAEPVLRKDTPLPQRLLPWPGAVDPAKPRRSQQPPGTPW